MLALVPADTSFRYDRLSIALRWATLVLPVRPDKELGKGLEDVRSLPGDTLYALTALHAPAALVHHNVGRDGTVRRTLHRPARR